MKTILPMSLRRRRQDHGRDLDRSARHRAPPHFQRQPDQAGTDRQENRSRSRVKTGHPHHRILARHRRPLIDVDEISALLVRYIWVNPHLTLQFVVDGKTVLRCDASNPDWTKYRACDATSAHWYTPEQFERYAGALIARDHESSAAERKSRSESSPPNSGA